MWPFKKKCSENNSTYQEHDVGAKEEAVQIKRVVQECRDKFNRKVARAKELLIELEQDSINP